MKWVVTGDKMINLDHVTSIWEWKEKRTLTFEYINDESDALDLSMEDFQWAFANAVDKDKAFVYVTERSK